MMTFSQETDSTSVCHIAEEREHPVWGRRTYYGTGEKTATVGSARLYRHVIRLPRASGLLEKAWSAIPEIENQEIAAEATRLLTAIDQTVQTFQESRVDLSGVPPLQLFRPDDGSILFEWIFDDFRVGFSIEPNPEESSWYLVSTPNLGEISASGRLTGIEIKMLTVWLLSFIGANCY